MPRPKLSLIVLVALVAAAVAGVDMRSIGSSIDRLVAGVIDGTGITAKAHFAQASAGSPIDPDRIYVYDGDTIIVDEQRMRLLDIDTPEISKPRCAAEEARGYEARDRLRALIAAAGIIEIADSGDRDKYSRPLIHLVVDGRDAGRSLVSEGLAVEWRPGPQAWRDRRRHWCGY